MDSMERREWRGGNPERRPGRVIVGVVRISEGDLEALREQLESAFHEALGGVPEDLAIRSVVMTGEPGPALVQYACREEDLLVVGASCRGGLRRIWQRPVGAYCAGHAR